MDCGKAKKRIQFSEKALCKEFIPNSTVSIKEPKRPPTGRLLPCLKPLSQVFKTNDTDWEYGPSPNSNLNNTPYLPVDSEADKKQDAGEAKGYDQQDDQSDGYDDDQEYEETVPYLVPLNDIAVDGEAELTSQPKPLLKRRRRAEKDVLADVVLESELATDTTPSDDVELPTTQQKGLPKRRGRPPKAANPSASVLADVIVESEPATTITSDVIQVDATTQTSGHPKRRGRLPKCIPPSVSIASTEIAIQEAESSVMPPSGNVETDSSQPIAPKRRERPPKASQPPAAITTEVSVQDAPSTVSLAPGDVETDSSQPTAPKRRRRSRKDLQLMETNATGDVLIEVESPVSRAPLSESVLGNGQNNNNVPPRRKARNLKRIDVDASDYSDVENAVKTPTKRSSSFPTPTSFRNPLRTHVGPGQAVFGPCAAARIRQTPMELTEYLHSATLLRLTVSERKVMEKMIRAHCLASLDEKLNKYQSAALNIDEVKERLNKFNVDPTPDCDACVRTGKADNDNCFDSCKETRPHMKYVLDADQVYGAKVTYRNPMYVKGVARLPHLRLNSHNMDKLSDVIAPVKLRRIPHDPIVVHTCQKWYGTFEISKNHRTINANTKYIRPLFICRSIFSQNGWQKQSELLQEKIDSRKSRYLRSYDQKPRRRTSSVPRNVEATRYSTSRSKLRVRISRSVSPVRKCHPASSNSKPIAIKSAFEACGETFSFVDGITEVDEDKVKQKPFLSMPMDHAGQTAFFSFTSADKSVIMPSRPVGINAQQGFFFKKCSVQAIGPSWMNVFEFTVIEDQMFEYLFRMQVGNTSNELRELRPVADGGAVMPIRIVYNYLRLTRKVPKPATWVKHAPKAPTIITDQESCRKKEPKKDVILAERPGGHIPVVFTLHDVLKFLGMYSIHVKPNNPIYACTMAYLSTNPSAAKKAKTLFDLLKLTYDCQGICAPKTPEFDLVRRHLMWLGKYNKAHTPELRLLRTKVQYVPSNKAHTNLCCFMLERKLNVMEQLSINSELEDFWQRFSEIRSDSDSDEFDSDVASDYDWDFGAMVYHLGAPKVVFPDSYFTGKVKMLDFRGKDISDAVPNSKLLDDIREKQNCVAEVRPRNKRYKRRYKVWDESSDEEEAIDASRPKVARILADGEIEDFNAMPPPVFYASDADESMIDPTVEMTAPGEFDDVQSAGPSVPTAPVCVLEPIYLDQENSSNGIPAGDDEEDEYEAVFENYAARL